MTTYYVTKYALSRGIYKAECVPAYTEGRVIEKGDAYKQYLTVNRDCFETKTEAENDARERASKKLKQLHKQEAKLVLLAANPKWAKS